MSEIKEVRLIVHHFSAKLLESKTRTNKPYDLSVKLQRIEIDLAWTLNRTGPKLIKKKLSWRCSPWTWWTASHRPPGFFLLFIAGFILKSCGVCGGLSLSLSLTIGQIQSSLKLCEGWSRPWKKAIILYSYENRESEHTNFSARFLVISRTSSSLSLPMISRNALKNI